ncbi:hypothetical protein [Calothrix parietina]|nr:hypothetical protein [Calothrix parietina]
MKNSIPLWVEFLDIGNWAWGMGHGKEHHKPQAAGRALYAPVSP